MSIALQARNLVKHFGGVVALSDGNLEVQSGEVVALVGANGSGKSTLSKIITGAIAPDEGRLLLDDQPYRPSSPQDAINRGIAAVYQELSLVPEMTVYENIWLAHERVGNLGLMEYGEMIRRTDELLEIFSGTVSESMHAETLVRNCSPDEQQIVEILKVLSLEPRLVILDEATASLGGQQVDRLFDRVEEWKHRDMAVVFITHRMDEVFRLADRITVLRGGETVADLPSDQTNQDELVEWMVGETTVRERKRVSELEDTQTALEVRNLRTSVLGGIDFRARRGEILGLGGLHGQGQSNLLHALFGDIPHLGEILLDGETVSFSHPRHAMQKGVALVPGDRSTEGLMLIRTVLENLLLPSWSKYGWYTRIEEARDDAQKQADELNLVMSSLDAPVRSLSGGNAQKVVLGKWLLRDPRLLLLDDPTKGVDVGTKADFYSLLGELREQGTTILFYSSDEDELLDLCDHILVLYDGRISAELQGERLTKQALVEASMGSGETAPVS